MKAFIWITLFLTTAPLEVSGTLRGWSEQALSPPRDVLFDKVNHINATVSTERKLSGGMFAALDCNSNLEAQPCTSWTSAFTSATNHATKVVIPCNKCITMDLVATSLTLAGGLDIQGKLVFPDGYKLTMNAPFIVVQGVLQMTSTKMPNGEEIVKFVMTGTDVIKFAPAENNVDACNGECTVGKKPIVVAGGKLVIEALPPNTPTWLPLHDISTDSTAETLPPAAYDSYEAPPLIDGCDEQGIYIREDFSSPIGSNFVGTLGTNITYANSRLLVHNRTSSRHWINVDLKDVRHCLQPDRTYLLTARFKLVKPGAQLTECAETGSGCLQIRHEWMRDNASKPLKTIVEERKAHQKKYNELITLTAEVTFELDQLNPSNIFQAIRIYGPGPGVDIEFDHFELRLPPPSLYPPANNVCGNLVPVSNASETVTYHPFPFRTRDDSNVLLDVKRDENDKFDFFALSGRSSDADGISWEVAPGCIKQDAMYNFHADIRVHDNVKSTPMKIWLKSYVEGSASIYTNVGVCPPSNNGWVPCDLTTTIPPSTIEGAPYRYEMYFELDKDPTLDYDVKGISFEFSGSSSGIVVSDTAKGKWAVGAEILMTSHTLNYDDEQVRKITGVRDHSETGYVVLELDSTFIRPTTETDNPDYAVEVALLSRNIVFEGAEDDPNQFHGAHLIVLHTPLIEQKLEGVEFRNAGQQGNLGRYPIHFHMCGDVTGSVVSKNLIRKSNQRCIVVHRSHNLLVDGNVAYDTFGHCFMTEDGNEKGNTFSYNLGALTRRAIDLIPDDGTNGRESDDDAATFWMTNPSNKWIGNVAAGSESNGYWLELKYEVRGPNPEEFAHIYPKEEPLTLFSNNVAHSNKDQGMRLYPSGFFPDEQALFLNSRFYRNRDGVFVHKCRNLALVGGIYGDSRVQIDVDRADNIHIQDLKVVGTSDAYSSIVDTQGTPTICDLYGRLNRGRSNVGIQLHTFVNEVEGSGAVIKNVTFAGFGASDCDKVAAITFDEEIRQGTFDYFTSLSQVQVEESTAVVDFCDAETAGVSSLYIIDLDSSLRRTSSTFSGASAIVAGNNPFVLTDRCIPSLDQCFSYCEDTCLRTVTFAIDPADTQDYKLKVCDVNSNICSEIDGRYWFYEDKTELKTRMRNTQADRFRFFSIALPKGSYTAAFLNDTGSVAWPTWVDEINEDAICPDSLMEGSVAVQAPPLASDECDDLIRNGDAEASDSNPLYWLHRRGGVTLNTTQGRNGTAALGDIERTSAAKDAIAQYLDTRCLAANQGSFFEISAWVKLVDPVNGKVYHCNADTEICPDIGISASSASGTWSKEPVATTMKKDPVDGYQLVHGVLEINEEMATATSVLFYVGRNKKGLAMLVDDVSMKRTDAPQGADNAITKPATSNAGRNALNAFALGAVCIFLLYLTHSTTYWSAGAD